MTWLDAMVGVPVPVDLRFVAPRGLPLVPKGSNSVLGSVSGLGAALMRARIDVAALKEDDLLSLASIPQPPSEILMLMTIVCVLGGYGSCQSGWRVHLACCNALPLHRYSNCLARSHRGHAPRCYCSLPSLWICCCSCMLMMCR